jgi:hypothetical protein
MQFYSENCMQVVQVECRLLSNFQTLAESECVAHRKQARADGCPFSLLEELRIVRRLAGFYCRTASSVISMYDSDQSNNRGHRCSLFCEHLSPLILN